MKLGKDRLGLTFKEVVGDDARLFDDALFLRTHQQADELRHAPRERGRTTGSESKNEVRCRRLRPIPDLFWNHAARVCQMKHGVEILRGIAAESNFVFSALGCKDRTES